MHDLLDIKIIPKSQLSPARYAEIVALCSDAFEENYTPYLESFVDATHIVGYTQNRIVCHALWITRWLQIGDDPLIRTAYVEGVATDQNYRGYGYATAVMRRLVNEITDFEIGALSPAETSLYDRLGWQYWQGPLFHRKAGKRIPDPEEEVMIYRLPQTPKIDFSQPLSIEWREGEVW